MPSVPSLLTIHPPVGLPLASCVSQFGHLQSLVFVAPIQSGRVAGVLDVVLVASGIGHIIPVAYTVCHNINSLIVMYKVYKIIKL
jgi:hypothetical protein